jgi:hypothetical protein
MAERLSTYLLKQIQELDEREDEGLSKEDCKEAQRVMELITRAFLESRLALTDQMVARSLEALPSFDRETVSSMFDDHYTRLLLANIPKYVKRTQQLSALVVKNIPSDEARLYVREAGRNYVFGHWLSSIALARAALEVALRECISAAGVTPGRELQDLITRAGKMRLLDGPTQHFAREVQITGNAIIHAAPKSQPKGQKTFDTLANLRGVLRHLYGDADGRAALRRSLPRSLPAPVFGCLSDKVDANAVTKCSLRIKAFTGQPCSPCAGRAAQ